jgi:uncharacterized protein YoxC
MTEPAAWILVALAVVLVAAFIPVLIQLRRTLKAAEQTLESTGRRVNDALDGLTATLERVNRAVDGLEQGVSRVSSLLEVLGGIGDTLSKVKSSIGTVASLGSIVGTAVLAGLGFRSRAAQRKSETAERAAQEE